MHASTLFVSVATAAFFTLAEAHGAVGKIQVAGQTFTSPLINAAGDTGPFYVPSDNSPITDVTSDNMFCGTVGNKATSTPSIDLSKGNTISFYWDSGYTAGTDWPHNTGPMFLYIAKCDDDCSSMTASSTNFIKVEQQGIVNGAWAQAALKSGQPATFTIPSDLSSGKYLLRHEVINLASTDENYPACSQFDITGGSNDYSSAQTAKFPGAYSASDAGLVVAGGAVYSVKSDADYVFPGPDPITSSDGSSSGSSSSSASSSSSGSSSSAASGSNVAASPSSVLAVSASISLPTPSLSTSSAANTSVPATTSSSTSSSSSSSGQGTDSCASAWTTCNAAYMSATSSASTTGIAVSTPYTCQTDFENCVAQSMSGVSSATASSSGVEVSTTASDASVSSSSSASSSSAEAVTPSASVSARSSFGKHLRRHHAGLSRLELH